MTYPLQLLQHTAHYVISRCRYEDDGKKLNHTSEKWAYRHLLQALNELQKRQTQAMVISPDNGALNAFFDELSDMKIAFPENTTFIIKLKGTHSYEKVIKSKLPLDDRIRLLAGHIVEQCRTSRGNGLSQVQVEMARELLEQNLHELCLQKRAMVVIRQGNSALEDMFHQFACADIAFPHPAKFELHRNGQCIEKKGRDKTVVYEPQVEKNKIYSFAENKNKGRRRKSKHKANMAHADDAQDVNVDDLFGHVNPLMFSKKPRANNVGSNASRKSRQSNQNHQKLQLR